MDYQRYLVRKFNYQMILEVLKPFQFAVLLVSPCLIYDHLSAAAATATGIFQWRGAELLNEWPAIHNCAPVPALPQEISRFLLVITDRVLGAIAIRARGCCS